MKYIEAYPNCLTNNIGLISMITDQDNCPWKSFSAIKDNLEKAFAWQHSQKTLFHLFTSDLNLADFTLAHFQQKWEKLWSDFTLEYSQTHATYIDESEKIGITENRENTTQYGRTSSDTGTVTDVIDEDSNSQGNVWGYNSQASVPANSATGSVDSTNTRTDNTVNTLGGSDTNSVNRSYDETKTIDRKGNIGWFTPQNMISDDIELWMRNYFDIVFADITKFIFLEVYS